MPCLDLDPRPATTLHRHLSPLLPPSISPSLHLSIPLHPSPSLPPSLPLSLSPSLHSLSLSLLPALLDPGQRLLGNPRARHAVTFSFMFAGPAQSHLCMHPGCGASLGLSGDAATPSRAQWLGWAHHSRRKLHPTDWALQTDCGCHCGQTEAARTLGGYWDMLGLCLNIQGHQDF